LLDREKREVKKKKDGAEIPFETFATEIREGMGGLKRENG